MLLKHMGFASLTFRMWDSHRQIACHCTSDRCCGAPQLLKYLLANGSMEYKSAKEEKGILAGDERELEEPLLANLLHGKVNTP